MRTWLASAGVAIASVAASILAPSALIAAYAGVTTNAAAVTRFALRVAEPTALAAAVAVVLLLPARASRRAGLLRGAAAAVAMGAAALWVGDVDAWTYAALGLLPLAGALRAGRGGTPARVACGAAIHDAMACEALPPAAIDATVRVEPARERVTPR